MEGGEEEDPSNPAQTTAKTLDHPKHAAMLERLSNRKHHQSPSRKPDHSAQTFLSLFAQSKLSIDSSVSLVRHSADRTNPALKSDLERISVSISDLEKLVAENSYSLPPFELRTCLGTIASLKRTLDALASDMVPKRRFSFKNKKFETPKTESEEKAPGGVVDVIESEKTSETELEGKPSLRVWDSPGFKDGENEVLVREFKGLETGEFSLTGLSSCEVRLTGCLRALFVHKLRDCKVNVGPVFGSVLIEDVEGCVFVLASHQIRIHHARRSDFYLRVRSRPIIEDCSGVRFAPYCLGYDGIERDLKESNLDEETGNWANVDDFRWLKAVQSPNWTILPESERIGRVTILNSDK